MATDIRYHAADTYLIAEVLGRWEDGDAQHAIDTIREEADRRDQTRLFLDLSNLEPPEKGLTRFFAGEYAAKRWGHPFKTAILWIPAHYNGFGETVAMNRGANIKVFFEKEAAVEWLLK